MYEIYSDGRLIYSPAMTDSGYIVIGPKINRKLNCAGSLTFTLPPSNPMYSGIKKMKSIITVLDDGKEIFRGRVLNSERDFYNRKTVYCEGDLAFLLDSVQRPFEYTGDIPELFEYFLTRHNVDVDEEKRFRKGMVTVMDENNYINRSNSECSSTLEAMEDKLIKTHGGYLRTRLAEGEYYLDYIEDFGACNQVIRFGENLLDLTEYISAEDICTVLIPLGAEDENGKKLTVESVNGGRDYIENQTGIALFGRISAVREWEDVTRADNLLKKGRQLLDDAVKMAVTITVKAIDLKMIGVNAEKIEVGKSVRVISEPHGIDDFYQCTGIDLNLENPEQSEYTFGREMRTMTETQIAAEKKAASTGNEAEIKAKNAMDVAQGAAVIASGASGAAANAIEEVGRAVRMVEDLPKIPENVSAFQNDAGYLTAEDLPKIPENVSAFQNDAGYLTAEDLPEIPERMSQLENDAGYVTEDAAPEDAEWYMSILDRLDKLENPEEGGMENE